MSDERSITHEDLLALRRPNFEDRPAIAPDGDLVAFSVLVARDAVEKPGAAGALEMTKGSGLLVSDTRTGETHNVFLDGGRGWRPSWSPDGSRLAFYSDRDGSVHLWLWDRETGEARRVSDAPIHSQYGFSEFTDEPRWTTDGSGVVVALRREEANANPVDVDHENATTVEVYTSPPPDEPTVFVFRGFREHCDVARVEIATGAVTPLVSGEAVTRISPSQDARWLVLFGDVHQVPNSYVFTFDVSVVATDGGARTEIPGGIPMSAAGFSDPAWSPGGSTLAWVSKGLIHLLEASDGAIERLPTPFVCGEQLLLWTPDGKALLAYEVETPPDDGDTAIERMVASVADATVRDAPSIWLVPRDGREPTRLQLPGLKYEPIVIRRRDAGAAWSPDGTACGILAQDRETKRFEFWSVPFDGGAPSSLLSVDRKISSRSIDVTPDGRTIVYPCEDEATPPDLWAADGAFDHPRRITSLNPHLDGVAFGETRLVHWTTIDGQEVSGALLLPPGYSEGTRIPVMCEIYAGLDESRDLHAFDRSTRIVSPLLLGAEGYGVLHPQLPTRLPVMPTRGELTRGILPALNELIRLGIADPDRFGVLGQSGGGLAVNRIVTETTRFKVAVSANGVSNQVSAYGMLQPGSTFTSIGHWWLEPALGGPPWEAPLAYVEESPVFHLQRVETPLLLIHGTDDDACEWQQSAAMFVGLRRLGKEAVFLKYEGEGHVPEAFSLANRKHMTEQVLAFLAKHLN